VRGAALALVTALLAPALTASAQAELAPATPVSPSAQRAYDSSRDRLLQVRTLLRDQDSQSSVGSGFIVSPEGHAITNYHVVSQFALQPERYRLTYTRVDGTSGKLQLLAFDAVHDLALVLLVAAEGSAAPAAHPSLSFRPAAKALSRGERIHSLGNPLDVGFAVVEGNYNGLVERSFYPRIFFGGALNPGMSGGPALDAEGEVVGVNVATRRDGQQVSFLIPGELAQALLERGRSLPPITGDVHPELTRQLLAHQELLVQRFVDQTWRSAGHARYRIPVPQEQFMRCWGSGSPAEAKGMEYQQSNCVMDGAVFVGRRLQTGALSVRHEVYDGGKLGALRFARQYSASFRNESFGADTPVTPPQCKERFIDRDGLPLRAVVCLSAYRKLKGLFDVSVLVATVDASTEGALGRLDASGVDFDNALRLVDHYLQGFAWNESR
jgi:serine protease Do